MKACNSCGKCCTIYGNGGISPSDDDLEMWTLFRPDISDFVKNGQIWFSPSTGLQLDHCPWLRKLPNEQKYTCDIYFDRPEDCKFYPTSVEEMIRDECEMIESIDLTNIKLAQTKLDKLMEDSRPPLESNK